MKKVLFGIVALIVLLIAAALIGPSFVDWNKYKPEIVAKVREATGRELAIGGNISLSVLPSPTLSVEDVSLANIPGATEPRMASLKALDVRVAFGPLLSGTIKVESVALIDPMISLEVLKDGRRNWEITPARAPAAPAAPAKPEEAGAPEAGAAVQLEGGGRKSGSVVCGEARPAGARVRAAPRVPAPGRHRHRARRGRHHRSPRAGPPSAPLPCRPAGPAPVRRPA